uniref:Homeobox domain-containing protein n=1 Tax=Heterorhabditis bacteriophora TaxID=37862 RepID=A0A1I7X5W9_HETBA
MSPHKRRRRMISSSSVARSPQKMKVPKEELREEDLVEELHEELEEAGELGDGVGITVDDSVAEGEILHEEIIHEGDLVDEDVELEYVEEETEVPHMAHEVVMDGDIVEEYVEVEAAPDDDIATESLVALSRGPSNQHKTVRDFLRQTVQLNAKVRPRILRRTVNLQHEDYEEESMSRNQVLHTKFPVPSTTKPLLPVAIAGSSQPHQQQRNWREEQKRMLEIYEIYDSLPDNMRENFKQLLESRGEKVPVFRRNIPKKPGFGSLYPHPRIESESVTARDPHIDVEGYGSDDGDDDRNIRTGIDYILDSEGEDDAVFSEMRLPPTRRLPRDNVLGSRRVILPEMRADVFGSIDVRHFGARQIDKVLFCTLNWISFYNIIILLDNLGERERYCLRDSAVERRILALTPKDISNSNQSAQRTESLETESQPSVIGQPDAQGSRIPNGDDHLEEETDQTVEGLDKQREDERLEEAGLYLVHFRKIYKFSICTVTMFI